MKGFKCTLLWWRLYCSINFDKFSVAENRFVSKQLTVLIQIHTLPEPRDDAGEFMLALRRTGVVAIATFFPFAAFVTMVFLAGSSMKSSCATLFFGDLPGVFVLPTGLFATDFFGGLPGDFFGVFLFLDFSADEISLSNCLEYDCAVFLFFGVQLVLRFLTRVTLGIGLATLGELFSFSGSTVFLLSHLLSPPKFTT